MLTGERWQRVSIVRDRLIIWGASDQCRVNYPILKQLGCQIEALIDDTPNKESPFDDVPIFIGEQGLDKYLNETKVGDLGFIVAVGNPFGHIRMKLQNLMKDRGFLPVSFADPTALICKSAIYGEGLQVMPLAIVHNNVKIGDQCIINTRTLVEHDCILHNGVEIGPGAVLCGRVTIGQNTWIGANATIRPRVTIGSNSIIGAGAVVVTDIPSNVVVVGVPAKVIKENIKYE
jgi:sugar O-acyltransferase (sialic acid O-acetyltransferase NeuD family)